MAKRREWWEGLTLKRIVILFCFVLGVNVAFSQFTYVQDQSIPVYGKDGKSLSLPWTGGINAAQFNTMDLNGDEAEDLILFDRMANKVMTFLSENKSYRYAPEYESLFPSEITNWILLKDFNCDGKKDIFTGDISGMKVYQNSSRPGESVTWKPYLFYVEATKAKVIPLLTKGYTSMINLQLQYDDLPTIVDVDGDGDLDILNVRFTGNGSVEFHKNFSMERYGTCDSLTYERLTNTWGEVTQCKCSYFAFNNEQCLFPGGRQMENGRVLHAGGKALLALDIDNDKDIELLFSEAECNNIFLLKNRGDKDSPLLSTAEAYPFSRPVNLSTFPAAFYEDVDFDGLKDLISTPNIYRKDIYSQDLSSSTWLYKNTGTSAFPEFTYQKKNFLQSAMIDVGDNAVPAFMDEDGDGDMDLFISMNSDSTSFGSVYFYRNVGITGAPAFQFETNNYADLQSLKLRNLKIQFVDMNGNGKADLAFLATTDYYPTELFYILNTRENGLAIDPSDLRRITSVEIADTENFHFTEINHDGRVDLLIGRTTGALEYYQNTGTASSPQFYLQNKSYLGLGTSLTRQSLVPYAADLNNDGKEDMILVDQRGVISIIHDFHSVIGVAKEERTLSYNSLVDGYESTLLGRAWPTTAVLFNSKRPAIVAGTIRGGIQIFRNDDAELGFEDLILTVHPNPASGQTVSVTTNVGVMMDIITVEGKVLRSYTEINKGTTAIDISSFAKAVYIFRFTTGGRYVYKRIILI